MYNCLPIQLRLSIQDRPTPQIGYRASRQVLPGLMALLGLITKGRIRRALWVWVALCCWPCQAQVGDLTLETSRQIGAYTVQYSLMPSLSLQPDIAAHYGLTRARDKTLLSVSLLNQDGQSLGARVTGRHQNLMQQQKPLGFQHLNENGAHYALALITHHDQEVLHFYLALETPQGETLNLDFSRKLYQEPNP